MKIELRWCQWKWQSLQFRHFNTAKFAVGKMVSVHGQPKQKKTNQKKIYTKCLTLKINEIYMYANEIYIQISFVAWGQINAIFLGVCLCSVLSLFVCFVQIQTITTVNWIAYSPVKSVQNIYHGKTTQTKWNHQQIDVWWLQFHCECVFAFKLFS